MTDTQSLTLPRYDAKIRWRIRRPRRPSPARVILMLLTIMWAVAALPYLILGYWPRAGLCLMQVGLLWRLLVRDRRERFTIERMVMQPEWFSGVIVIAVAYELKVF